MKRAARQLAAPPRVYPFRTEFDPGRYPLPYLLQGWPEIAVQNQALGIAKMRGHFLVAVDAGAAPLRGRAIGAMRRAGVAHPERLLAGRTGTRKGVVDLVGCLKTGRAVFVEVKAPARYEPSPATRKPIVAERAGEPTEEQLDFLAAAHEHGALVGLIWSPNDMLDLLVEAGG